MLRGFSNGLGLGSCFGLGLTWLCRSLGSFCALKMKGNGFLASCCRTRLDLALLMARVGCGRVMEFSNITTYVLIDFNKLKSLFLMSDSDQIVSQACILRQKENMLDRP